MRNQGEPMQVSELWIYPVKSCRGIAVEQIEVTPTGLSQDRHWMIVDVQGQFLSQRTHPQMAQIGVALDAEQLVLSDGRGALDPIAVPRFGTGTERAVQVWKTRTMALDQGDAIAAWLTALIDTPCRLVRQLPTYPRPTNPDYAPGATVSFADGYPLLLTTTASLGELNRRIQAADPAAAPISMGQFRPNVVIDLDPDRAFAEDDWRSLQIGAVRFDSVKPCDRCIITTTDQTSGDRNPHQEPLKTLATFRRQQSKLLFGENLVPQTLGYLQRGNRLEILTTGPRPRL
ncbi:MOSC domain-containing protein [Spirulina major]|uniref:MOSC domain-containing protein n=1 Tax=Spirulina major TaxID=270636 RepID=UPI001FE27456|nr:MOSC N-terminal beta barrel domain-containing protein [Spirulina major]